MDEFSDIERYVKDPLLLGKLCRDVISRLNVLGNDGGSSETKIQLMRISQTIDKLEKDGVGIPDALRKEKLRLAAIFDQAAESVTVWRHLLQELKEIVDDLEKRLGKTFGPTDAKRKTGKPVSSRGDQTPREELIRLVLVSLKELGGSAQCNDVLAVMEKKMRGKFLPGDLENDPSFGVKWKHNAHWARLKLANDGDLDKHSPRGHWRLSKGGNP